MKTRYRLIRRGVRNNAFYCVDKHTGKRTSLCTATEAEAQQIVEAKNQAERQPVLNLQIAKAYLAATDATFVNRTWREVMAEFIKTKTGTNRTRSERAVLDKSFDSIRDLPVLETRPEHFLKVLQSPGFPPTITCGGFTILPWTWAGVLGRCCPNAGGQRFVTRRNAPSRRPSMRKSSPPRPSGRRRRGVGRRDGDFRGPTRTTSRTAGPITRCGGCSDRRRISLPTTKARRQAGIRRLLTGRIRPPVRWGILRPMDLGWMTWRGTWRNGVRIGI